MPFIAKIQFNTFETTDVALVISLFVLSILFSLYILWPLKFRRKFLMNFQSQLEPITPDQRDEFPNAAKFFDPALAALTNLGFELRCHVRFTDHYPDMRSTILILTHPRSYANCLLNLAVYQGKGFLQPVFVVCFRQTLTDDRSIELDNDRFTLPLPPFPDLVAEHLYVVKDTPTLFRAFQRFVEIHASAAQPSDIEMADPLTAANIEIKKHWQRRIDSRTFEYTPDKQKLKLSLKPAFALAWSHRWPFRQLAIKQKKRHQQKLFAQLLPNLPFPETQK